MVKTTFQNQIEKHNKKTFKLRNKFKVSYPPVIITQKQIKASRQEVVFLVICDSDLQ